MGPSDVQSADEDCLSASPAQPVCCRSVPMRLIQDVTHTQVPGYDQRMVLSTVVPDAIWVSERAVWFAGVRLRARSTVVRLADRRLLIHSPPQPSRELCDALDALGQIAYLVVPNCFHHLATPAFAAKYPSATVVGPRSAAAKNPDLKLHQELHVDIVRAALPEFAALALDGCPFLDETVLFHRPTGSLIGADLVISACAKDHFTWRWAARLTGCYDRICVPPDVRSRTRPSADLAHAIDRMTSLPLERILVAHCDPIVDRPAAQLAEAWQFGGATRR